MCVLLMKVDVQDFGCMHNRWSLVKVGTLTTVEYVEKLKDILSWTTSSQDMLLFVERKPGKVNN